MLLSPFFKSYVEFFYTKEERKTERQEIPVLNSSLCKCAYEYA